MDDWRDAYHSLDAGGSPDAACAVGERWIEDQATEAARAFNIERLSLERDGGSTILYLDTEPLAVATVFRTPLNRATLIRWKAGR